MLIHVAILLASRVVVELVKGSVSRVVVTLVICDVCL